MNNNKGLGAAVGIVVAVALVCLAGYGALKMFSGSTDSNGRGGDSNFDSVVLDSSLTVGTSITSTATTTQGSQGTTAYYVRGGVDYADAQVAFTSTSSSPAIIRNPWFGTATSTIDVGLAQITSGILGANTFDISTTTNCTGGNASSTPALVYGHSVATGAVDTVSWHPTSTTTKPALPYLADYTGVGADGSSPFILRSNECISLRIATSSPGTFAGGYWAGTLSFTFHKP